MPDKTPIYIGFELGRYREQFLRVQFMLPILLGYILFFLGKKIPRN